MKRNLLIRILALGLSAVTLLSAAACANTKDDPEENVSQDNATQPAEETVYTPDIEKKDYACDFNIVIGGTFVSDLILIESEEDAAANPLDNAVYERSESIKSHLGVTCVLQDAGSWTEYSGNVIRTVQAGDDDYQLVLTPVYQGVTDLITSGILYDFAEFEAVNLDAPYWSSDLMEEIKIEDQYLLGYNDACLSQVHCLVFNKAMQETYQLDSPYELVRNKQWTLDKLMEMASGISEDNGDGVRGAEDTYGITGWGWVYFISLITLSDLKIVDRDGEGNYVIAYETEKDKLLDLIDKCFELYDAEYAFFWKSYPDPGTEVEFSAGTSLFQFYSSTSLASLGDKDIRFGVLPYPMWDEKQEDYKTLNWNGLMAVPNSISNPQMVGEVLELMAYYTAPVKTAYYENLLSAKIAEAPDDVQMLDIIWASQTTDVGIVTCNSSGQMDTLVYMIPKMREAGNNTYSSYIQRNGRSAQNGLDRVFKQGKYAE